MLRNRLLAAAAAFALAVAQVNPCFALLPSPDLQTPDGTVTTKATTVGFVTTAIAKLKTDLLVLLQQSYTLQVPSAAAMRTTGVFTGVMAHRGGYASAGDGGGADYVGNSSACPNGDDGGSCLDAPGGSWRIDATAMWAPSLRIWGAKDDDTSDIQPILASAFAALSSLGGGGTLRLPPTTSCYRLNTPYTFSSATSLSLDARNSCLDVGFASGDGLTINGGSNILLAGMTLKHAVSRTSGNDIEVTGGARNVTLRNITCLANHWSCVGVDGGAAIISIEDLYVPGEGQTGICIGCEQNGIAANIVIKGGDFNFQHRAAIELQYASGITIRETNTDFNTHGLWAHPITYTSPSNTTVVEQVNGIDTDNTVYFDSSTQEGVLLDASQGSMLENRMLSSTWIVSCGTPIDPSFAKLYTGSFSVNPTASCLSVSGTASFLVDNMFDVLVFNAAGNGITLSGGTDNRFSGTTASNGSGCPSNNPCHGFAIAAGTFHWGWRGRAGGQTGIGSSSKQAYGVFINAGNGTNSDYYTVEGDLTGNASGGLFDGANGAHKLVSQILQ